jgi:hypothetical protein
VDRVECAVPRVVLGSCVVDQRDNGGGKGWEGGGRERVRENGQGRRGDERERGAKGICVGMCLATTDLGRRAASGPKRKRLLPANAEGKVYSCLRFVALLAPCRVCSGWVRDGGLMGIRVHHVDAHQAPRV